MTELDATILTISALLVVLSVAMGRGIGLAFIVFLSFTFNEWAFNVLDLSTWEAFYQTGAKWMVMIAAKDFIIICLLSYRLNFSEVWLILTFGASCIFHQVCRMEFTGGDAMPMYDVRFNFMQIIAALQITGVIINFTGGDWRGGRLVRLGFHRLNFYNRNVSSQKAFKVEK